MKKIYRYILISVLGVMGMSSCVDNLLDRTPIASLSPTTFYQDENQCRMALMGVYSALQPVTSTYWYQLDFMSDDAYCLARFHRIWWMEAKLFQHSSQ